MKPTYRLIRRKERKNQYYLLNRHTLERECLGTSDPAQARKLMDARNESRDQAALHLQLGVTYLQNADPLLAQRTWQTVMDEMCSHGKPVSQARTTREFALARYDTIRQKALVETTSEDLQAVLKRGGAATSHYLRRLHNHALANGWIRWHIIPVKLWGKPAKRPKRAITEAEHQRILAAEQNIERRNYYHLLWLVGIDEFWGFWKQSVEHLGTCAHDGVIPPQAITRIAVIDTSQCKAMCGEALEPVITLLNYKVCGPQFRLLTRWFMGEPVPLSEWLQAQSVNPVECLPERARKSAVNRISKMLRDQSCIKVVKP